MPESTYLTVAQRAACWPVTLRHLDAAIPNLDVPLTPAASLCQLGYGGARYLTYRMECRVPGLAADAAELARQAEERPGWATR